MYDRDIRPQASALIDRGMSLRAVHKSTGVSRATLRDWLNHPEKTGQRASCPRCATLPSLAEPAGDDANVLGLYLSDGCISVGGDPAKGVWALRSSCADAWPGLRAECIAALDFPFSSDERHKAVPPTSTGSGQQQVFYPAARGVHRGNCLFAALPVLVPRSMAPVRNTNEQSSWRRGTENPRTREPEDPRTRPPPTPILSC
jgi:hypothetical protein